MSSKRKRPDRGSGGADMVLDRLISATAEKDYVPTAADLDRSGRLRNVRPVEAYLKRFGYMQSEGLRAFGPAVMAAAQDLPAPTGRNDEALRESLRRFQELNQLPVTGALDAATLAAMSQPRCGFPDMSRGPAGSAAFAVQGNRWDRTDLTYSFQNFRLNLGENDIRTAFRQALDLWSAVTPLRFTESNPVGPTADIVILFAARDHGDGRQQAFDGPGGIYGHANFPPPWGGPLAGDAHFDNEEFWSINLPPSGIDLVTVAAHEIGHALGLAHSTVPSALMWPYYTGDRRALAPDDIAGIQSIYGAPGGWAQFGGVVTGRIAVARNADGRLEIFARGPDNALLHRWQTAPSNGWSDWSSLGGNITSDPTVINNQDGRLEIFARGLDNAVWHRWQTAPSNGWAAGWSRLGGEATGNIAVGRNGDGRLEVFTRAPDGAVWHIWQTAANNGWHHEWVSLGGNITSDPVVASNGDGRLEVFTRGLEHAIWHRWQIVANGGWSAYWSSLGGQVHTDFAVGRNADGWLEVFALGTDIAVWHRKQVWGGGWSDWESLGGILRSELTVINNEDGRFELFGRGNDNAVWRRSQGVPSGGFAGWNSLGGVISGGVAAGCNLDGRLEIFATAPDGVVWHRWQTAAGGGWS